MVPRRHSATFSACARVLPKRLVDASVQQQRDSVAVARLAEAVYLPVNSRRRRPGTVSREGPGRVPLRQRRVDVACVPDRVGRGAEGCDVEALLGVAEPPVSPLLYPRTPTLRAQPCVPGAGPQHADAVPHVCITSE